MASKTYIVSNSGPAICALGRTIVEIPAECKGLEMVVQGTDEMARTIARIMRLHPQCRFVEKTATVTKAQAKAEAKTATAKENGSTTK